VVALEGRVLLGGVTRGKGLQGTGAQEMPPGQGSERTLTPRSGGGRLSKCSELTVDYSESLGWIDKVYSDSRVRGTKAGDDGDG